MADSTALNSVASKGDVNVSLLPRQGLRRLHRTGMIGLGVLIIFLALAVVITGQSFSELLGWLRQMFGYGFIVVFLALVFLGGFSLLRMKTRQHVAYWYEVGQQAASGVATTALTFTLLGISLGIGSLSEQSLNPDTIQSIIQALTQHFSMAFMTTVVGLPSSAMLRAFLAIERVKQDAETK